MARVFGFLVVTVFGLIGIAPAAASPITFTDVFDPADMLLTRQSATCSGVNGAVDSISGNDCTTVSWTHLLQGFDQATDVLDEASLTIWLYDDEDNAAEKYDLTLDLLSDVRRTIVSETTGGDPFRFRYDVLGDLADGQLLAVLTVVNGDFTFDRSVLEASGTRGLVEPAAVPVSVVPEPASLILLGTGLAGAAAARRRRRA